VEGSWAEVADFAREGHLAAAHRKVLREDAGNAPGLSAGAFLNESQGAPRGNVSRGLVVASLVGAEAGG
jgi:hypothetical protein